MIFSWAAWLVSARLECCYINLTAVVALSARGGVKWGRDTWGAAYTIDILEEGRRVRTLPIGVNPVLLLFPLRLVERNLCIDGQLDLRK